MLKERQHRRLGRRVGGRREVTEDLVHVEQRTQTGGAALAPHPGDQLVEHQRDDEHALGIVQVGDGNDADARLAVTPEQQALRVEGFALRPGREAGRGQQAVHRHGQLEPLFRGIESLEVESADLFDAGLLYRLDQASQVETGAVLPTLLDQAREQDVVAALHRIGVAPEQRQQRRGDRADLLAQRRGVAGVGGAGIGQRAQHRQSEAGISAGRVDADRRGRAQPRDTLGRLVPIREALLPARRGLLGELLDREVLAGGVLRVNPRPEIRGRQLRKGQQQVGDVTLGIDADCRDAVDGSLLEHAQAQPGLAAARHADADRVRGEVARVDEQRFSLHLAGSRVDFAAEVEGAELFVIGIHCLVPGPLTPAAGCRHTAPYAYSCPDRGKPLVVALLQNRSGPWAIFVQILNFSQAPDPSPESHRDGSFFLDASC